MPDLDALLAEDRRRPAARQPQGLPPEIATARSAEVRRRWTIARNMAQTALRRLHHDDYRALTEQARKRVEAEYGPLPGDPDATS